jgi:hypothetical protein
LTIVSSPPPTSFFDLTSEKSGSTPVAIHHEADRSRRREHRRLRVAVAVHLAGIQRLVPRAPAGRQQLPRHRIRVFDVPDRGSVLGDHADHCRGVPLVALERAHPLGHLG